MIHFKKFKKSQLNTCTHTHTHLLDISEQGFYQHERHIKESVLLSKA